MQVVDRVVHTVFHDKRSGVGLGGEWACLLRVTAHHYAWKGTGNVQNILKLDV